MNPLSQDQNIRLSAAQIEVRNSDRRTMAALEALIKSTQREFDSLWNNPKASPASQLTIRGDKAVAGFQLHAAAVALCQQAGLEYDYTKLVPPVAYTPHQDGTITLD